jgi:hypothetical protein
VQLASKYRALLAPEKASSLWSFAQARIYPLVRSKFESFPQLPGVFERLSVKGAHDATTRLHHWHHRCRARGLKA